MSRDHQQIRAGVVGLGNMGRHHVRVLSEMEGVDLVAAADVSEERRMATETLRHVPTFTDYEEMLAASDLDALVIAVPTLLHEEVVVAAIDAGLHFLVEKPLAPTRETAEHLADKARASGLVATVGHVERYNPVVTAAKRGLEADELGRVFQVRAHRAGPIPERIHDVGVVLDLATHDFDVAQFLVGQPVERVFAETARKMHSKHEDLFSGLMRFSTGVIAMFEVNWLTPIKIREIRVLGGGGMYLIDLLAQDLYFYENSHVASWSDFSGRLGVSEGNMVKYRIDRAEPLALEHQEFMKAIRGEPAADLVSMDDGVSAVALAEAMVLSAKVHRAVWGSGLQEFAESPFSSSSDAAS